ncbi:MULTISPECIES: ABC transporter permease [Actinokineospora]|uniref:Oligopeptide transport system permease protein OppC n=1 Tax=Actinokineospora fastidiosa TaxID=1816 RepID=A0A918GKI0_9PSEU|nr:MULTISPECIES: ABC transporter permease [Actinokineospora]UVS77285.1 Stage 0 sporulation protein KC [Actinokineospora sp. UTMC 2448]GGS44361.1 ABC transporter permease [Actinokineospora fastidiosa]
MATITSDAAAPGASPVDGGAPKRERSATRSRLVLRRFLRRKGAVFGLIVVVLLYLMAFLGPLISPWGYAEPDYTAFLQPPSAEHWFGTTKIGEDVFAQVMRGLQKSLTIGLLVGVISTSVAALVGALAGYFGGWVDRTLMWVVDLLLVLPSFLIIAVLSPAFKGESWLLFVALLAAFSWMITARIVRGMTLTLREREYVKAARFMGQSPLRIIFKHIVPNMASLLIIDATITIGAAVLSETGLSFFGFGVQPPDVSLGTLIATGTDSVITYPWLFYLPAGFLVLFVLAVNLFGDGLRDALDPSSTRARKRATKSEEESE